MKNRPVYRRIPVDYAPVQDLSIDIKTMPQAFGGYHLLLVIPCDQTNFTIAVPLRDRQTQTVAKALIYRVIYLFGLPRQIVCDEANCSITLHVNCKIAVFHEHSSTYQGKDQVLIINLHCLVDREMVLRAQELAPSGIMLIILSQKCNIYKAKQKFQNLAAIGGMLIKGINAKRVSSFNNAI